MLLCLARVKGTDEGHTAKGPTCVARITHEAQVSDAIHEVGLIGVKGFDADGVAQIACLALLVFGLYPQVCNDFV